MYKLLSAFNRFVFFFCFLTPLISAAQSSFISGVINSYAHVITATGCNVIVNDASAFAVGDRVVIMQMKGAVIDTSNSASFGDVINMNNAGNYEFAYISSINGNIIHFTAPLQRAYDAYGSVQLIKVPQYTDAVISAPVTCPLWNGTLGGVIVIECTGTLTFNDSINAKSKGFDYGDYSPTGYNCPGHFDYYYSSTDYFGGEKGEGITVVSSLRNNGMGKRANGGGGGNNVNAGGGGGGNYGQGGNGGYSWEGCPIMDIGGRGGLALSYSNALNKVFMGGGGGGGQQNNLQATAGTAGGGIVIIRANSVVGNGRTINASADNTLTGGCDGAGGGGAGGTVLLDVNSFSGNLKVNVRGANGSVTSCYAQGASGGGGGGCVWSKLPLPANVTFDVSGGIRGIHGTGSQNGMPGDTLSGLVVPFSEKSGVTINTLPVCSGVAMSFSGLTSDTASAYFWDFGDGDTSLLQNPSHTYTDSGTYNVTFIATYYTGCADTTTKPVIVYPNPVAHFTFSDVCFGDTLHFSDSSTVGGTATIASYVWSFGDGSPTSPHQNPGHYYNSPGNYSVTLVSISSNGCSDVAILPVHVYDAPQSFFTFSDVCAMTSATFTNTSTPPTLGTTASWKWNFGDGSPVNTTSSSPVHQYTTPGSYEVILISQSSNLGCADTLKDTIIVFSVPTAGFTAQEVCVNNTMNFTDVSFISGGDSITSWQWNFGDSSPLSTTQNPTHPYTTIGTHFVTLVVSSNNACADTLTDSVKIHPLPIADFTTNNVCFGSTANFMDNSAMPSFNPFNDNIVSQIWNYGDGSPELTVNTPHTYSVAGTYTAKLVVQSSSTCVDSVFKTIVVNPVAVVSFTTADTSGCEPLCVNFQQAAVITGGTINSYQWNYGDGSSLSAEQNPTHCYTTSMLNTSEEFDVSLTVTTDSACVSTLSISDYITVFPKPEADFTVAPDEVTEINPVISIADASIGVTQWDWSFGDSTNNIMLSSMAALLEHTYSQTGTYTVTLIAQNQYVCKDTASKQVIVSEDFILYVPNAFSPNGDGVNDVFAPQGTFNGTFEMRIYNKWGQQIFISNDFATGWDGRMGASAEPVKADVYVYAIKTTDTQNKKHNYKGIVTLVR